MVTEHKADMGEKSSRPIAVGSILADRYEVIKTLGAGGMGRVFMARHKQVGRTYAIKVMWKSKEDDQRDYKRFLQEAKIAGSFSHANLASVYDYGETDEGYAFLVMDFVDGLSLDELLSQNSSIDLARALKIFLQICAGLAYAHEKGLVHRDLKPANIMVVANNGQEQVKIVDFGITKILAAVGESEQDLTRAGETFGSPFYLSPEQCLGYPVDARSDIYSLGCLMYQTLAGRKPFEGGTAVETIVKHLQGPPQPFSEACPEKNLPARVEHIVFKCMERDPSDRYQSLTEVAADLSGSLESDSGGARDASKVPVDRQDSKPAPSTVAVVAGRERIIPERRVILAVLALIGGIGFVCYLSSTPKQTEVVRPDATGVSKSQTNAPVPDEGKKDGGEPRILINSVGSQTFDPEGNSAGTTISPRAKTVIDEGGAATTEASQKALGPVTAEREAKPVKKMPTAQAVSQAETGSSARLARSEPARNKLASLDRAAQSRLLEAGKRLAHLQAEVIPHIVQEFDGITQSAIRFDVDWASFAGNDVALEYLEHSGLQEIREAISEFWLEHKPQDLKGLVTTIKIKNVKEIYERQVFLKSGVLVVHGAWGQGIKGSPTSLEIKLAIAAAM